MVVVVMLLSQSRAEEPLEDCRLDDPADNGQEDTDGENRTYSDTHTVAGTAASFPAIAVVVAAAYCGHPAPLSLPYSAILIFFFSSAMGVMDILWPLSLDHAGGL